MWRRTSSGRVIRAIEGPPTTSRAYIGPLFYIDHQLRRRRVASGLVTGRFRLHERRWGSQDEQAGRWNKSSLCLATLAIFTHVPGHDRGGQVTRVRVVPRRIVQELSIASMNDWTFYEELLQRIL